MKCYEILTQPRLDTDFKLEQFLILSLDAGNPASYPGTGNTWIDLINGKEFTLHGYGDPTYDSSNGGCLVFDPTKSQFAQSSSLPSSLTNWTIETWLYHDSTKMTGEFPCIVTEIFNTNPVNFILGSISNKDYNLQTGFFDGRWNYTSNNIALTSGNWYQIIATRSDSAMKLYINNTIADQSPVESRSSSGGQGIKLMARWDCGECWGGKLSIVKIYNADIGINGVDASWNANKTRFGL